MEKSDMMYGTRAVMEAILAGKPIDKIMVQSGLNNDLIKELVLTARGKKVPLTFVPAEKLKRMSAKNHQGVIALLSSVSYSTLSDIVASVFNEGRDPFILILDRVTDVRNFGALARTAECAGVDAIVIAEKGNAPITGDAMKTSAGALHHIPVCREADLKKTIRSLQDSGIRVVACTEKAEKTIYDVIFKGPTALVMGSEEDGIDDTLLRAVDELAKIPMKGKIESLNVSVAAGITIYEVVRQWAKN